MASVQNLPGVWVALASVDAYSNIRRLHSRPIGVPTPDTTHHSLEVIDGMKVVILIKLVLSMLRDSDAELIEVAMRFDGFNVAHHHIPVTEILAGGGVYPFVTFLDGMTSMAKTAEFRAITTATSSSGEDANTLLRAQRVGKIQVDVRHEKGIPVEGRSGSLHNLRHDGSYSSYIRDRSRATHFIKFDNPHPHVQNMITVVRNAQVGDTGHFMFHYGSKEILAQLDGLAHLVSPSVPGILPDRVPSGYLTTGTPSTAINPNSQHPNVGSVNHSPNAASADAGVPTVSTNPHAASRPATDGGGVPSLPVVPSAESATGSGGNDSAETGGSTVFVTSQAVSPTATGSGGVSSSPVVPQRASITYAAPDSSGGPPRKKRKLEGKLEEKQSKDSQDRTKE